MKHKLVMDWHPVQGVPCLPLDDGWERLWRPSEQDEAKVEKNGWMDINSEPSAA